MTHRTHGERPVTFRRALGGFLTVLSVCLLSVWLLVQGI